MSLSSRLQRLFPEIRFPQDPRFLTSDALSVLSNYCSERGTTHESIPSDIANDFVSVLRYAPVSLSTRLIAERTGLDTVIQYITTEAYHSNRSESPQVAVDWDDLLLDLNVEGEVQRLVAQAVEEPAIESTPRRVVLNNPFPDMIASSSRRRRNERDMMMDVVRSVNFPRPNFKDMSSQELNDIMDDWCRNVEYKEHWIFSRREREGFNRRNIGQFSLDDVMSRIGKRKNPHPLDSSFSKFYDWKLGGTDWILRLELFQHKQHYFLIIRHIYKPLDAEVKFDVRYWSQEKFKQLGQLWSEEENREDKFERVFGTHDENSDYYVEPYEYDEDEEYEEDYDDDCVGACEDSDF